MESKESAHASAAPRADDASHRRAARLNAAVYLLATVLAKLGAFLLIPIYTRHLTVPEYGDFALAQTILGLLPTLLSLGMSAAVSKFYFDEKDPEAGRRRAGGVARGMMATTAVLGAVAAGLAATVGPHLDLGLDRGTLVLLVAGGAGACITTIPDVYLRCAQRPLAAASLQLLSFLLHAGLGILLVVVLGRGLVGAVEALCASAVATGVVGAVFVVRVLGGALTSAELRRAIAFSLPFVAHFLAGWLQTSADRWIMKSFGREAELAVYVLASQVVAPATMVVAAWNDAQFARMGVALREGGVRRVRAMLGPFYWSYLGLAAVVALAIVVGSPLLPLVVGDRFSAATALVPFLCGISIVDAAYYPGSNAVTYAARTGVVPVVTVLAALTGGALAIALLPSLGVAGILIARLGASLVRSGGMYAAARWSLERPA